MTSLFTRKTRGERNQSTMIKRKRSIAPSANFASTIWKKWLSCAASTSTTKSVLAPGFLRRKAAPRVESDSSSQNSHLIGEANNQTETEYY